MKRVLGVLVVLALCAVPSWATEFRVFGSYWNTSDVDDTFGGGLALGLPLGASPLSLHFRGSYYQELTDEPLDNLFDDDDDQDFFAEDSLEVLPIEAGLHYTFTPDGNFSPWIGAGVTYFLIDTTREGVNVDDETGWHVSVGSRIGNRTGVNFFAEALYRTTEATLERERDDDVDLEDEVAIDLDGFAVNAGLLWRW